MLITWAWSCPMGVWKYSALNFAIYFDIAFVVERWLVSKEETSLVPEATPKATQYNTKWGRKVFEEWQQRRQNTCAMLEVQRWSG